MTLRKQRSERAGPGRNTELILAAPIVRAVIGGLALVYDIVRHDRKARR